MFTQRVIFALLAISNLLAFAAFSVTDKASDDQKLASDLRGIVRNILTGKDLDRASAVIDAEAYLVDGKYFESLLGVLHGEFKNCKLLEGGESKTIFEQLVIADNRSAAYMVMKTHSPNLGERFHSIVFFKDAENQWKIKSWHTGS
jgi:hypothetical protein